MPGQDDDLAFGPSVRGGADLWFEPELHNMFCFSSELGAALTKAGLADWFDLRTARILP